MSHYNDLARNSTYSLLSKLIVASVTSSFFILIARKLSVNDLAIFATLNILYGILEILRGMGMTSAAIKSVPDLLQTGNVTEAYSLIKSSLVYPTVLSLPLCSLVVLQSEALSRFFLKSAAYGHDLRIIGVTLFFLSLTNLFLLLLQSVQEFFWQGILNIFSIILQRSIALVFLILGYGISGVLSGFLIGGLASSLFGLFLLRRPIKYGRVSSFSALMRRSSIFYGSGIVRFMCSQVDQLLVAAFLSPQKLAAYFVVKKIKDLATPILDSLVEPIASKLSQLQNVDRDLSDTILLKSIFYTCIASAVISGLVITNSDAILDIVGKGKYSDVNPVLLLLMLSTLAYSIFLVLNGYIFVRRAPVNVLKMTISTGLVNIFVTVILISLFGIVGGAMAQIITFSFGAVYAQYLVGRGLKIEWFKLLSKPSALILSAFLLNFLSPLIVLQTKHLMVNFIYFALIILIAGKDIRNVFWVIKG